MVQPRELWSLRSVTATVLDNYDIAGTKQLDGLPEGISSGPIAQTGTPQADAGFPTDGEGAIPCIVSALFPSHLHCLPCCHYGSKGP